MRRLGVLLVLLLLLLQAAESVVAGRRYLNYARVER